MIVNVKAKLAIFLPSLNGGGAERSMLNLAQGLAERGYAVDLVLAQAVGPYLAEVPESVGVVDLKASRVLSSLPGLVRYLRRERPKTLLSVMNHANVVALWARHLAGIPVRIGVNEQVTISYSSPHSLQWRQRLMPWLIKHFYPWADHIIGNSTGVADDLSQVTRLPREQILVIYNPVVTPDLKEKARASLSHPWLKPGQPPVLLAVGRLQVQKDYPTLIQALARVRQTRPLRLLILGEGSDRPALEALVKQLGLEQDVSLPGFVENPYAYMARASLFVLSSRFEGLPTVLIEALYCGAPLVATDCPSGPREILRDGQYGQLVPVGDVAALARAIENTLGGKQPRPPRESWFPYALGPIVHQYVNIMGMTNEKCRSSPL